MGIGKKKYPAVDLKESLWSAGRATTILAWERAMIRMKILYEASWNKMNDVPSQF